MVKKAPTTDSSAAPARGEFPFSGNLKDSAQQIWLAGLGAFTKAQAEGSKVFDALVKEGTAMQYKTQAVASDVQHKVTGQWDKLETIFEDRVAKALHRLGVPSAQDVAALSARIDELERALKQKAKQPAAAKRKP